MAINNIEDKQKGLSVRTIINQVIAWVNAAGNYVGELIGAHNTNPAAHQDIRGDVEAESTARQQGDANTLNSAKQDANNKISVHNTAIDAHADIRVAIDAESTARQQGCQTLDNRITGLHSTVGQLADNFDTHNEDEVRHVSNAVTSANAYTDDAVAQERDRAQGVEAGKVEAATIGGVAVPKVGSILQFPAYPTLEPGGGTDQLNSPDQIIRLSLDNILLEQAAFCTKTYCWYTPQQDSPTNSQENFYLTITTFNDPQQCKVVVKQAFCDGAWERSKYEGSWTPWKKSVDTNNLPQVFVSSTDPDGKPGDLWIQP